MLLPMLDTTREDLQRSLQARAYELEHGAAEQPRRAITNRVLSHLSESQAQELQERLCALIDEFAEADSKQVDDQLYAFTVVFYPTFYYPEGNKMPGADRRKE